MVAWPAVAGALTATVALLNVVKRKRAKDLYKVPLASGCLPIVGRISMLPAVKAGKIHTVWEELADEAGDAPLIRMSILGNVMVLCASPAAAEVVLRKLKWTPKFFEGYKTFFYFAPSMIMTPDEAEHVALRKEFNKFFCSENITAVIAQLTQEMETVCDEVARIAARAGGAARCDVSQFANDIISNVVLKVFFEIDDKVDLTAFADCVEQAGQVSMRPLAQLAARHGRGAAHARYARNYRDMRHEWTKLLRSAFERELPEGSRAFWACVRRAFPQALTDKRQHERALSNTGLIYAAGSETTVNAIAFALGALALDGEARAALEQELEEAGLLETQDNSTPRRPDGKDLVNLKYLDALFHELMRVMPPAPSGTLRTLDREAEVEGYTLPKGATVLISPWAIQRSRAAWGDDAKAWRPARWLEGRSVNAAKKDAAGAARWLPFSDGRQNCIGQHLATIETKLAVAMIVSRFHVATDPEALTHKTVDEFAAACTAYITLKHPGGVGLTLTPRIPSAAPVA